MKKFAGFTPDQQFKLLSKQGYTGPADQASMEKFLAASPSAASKMGEYAQMAQQRLAGKPMPTQAMADGGMVGSMLGNLAEPVAAPPTTTTTTDATDPWKSATTSELEKQITADPEAFAKQTEDQIKSSNITLSEAQAALANDPTNPALQATVTSAQKALEDLQRKSGLAQQYITSPIDTLMQGSVTDPESVVTKAEVAKVPEAAGTVIPEGTGQTGAQAPAQTTTVGTTAEAVAPKETDAAVIDASLISDQAKAELDQLEAAKGQVSAAGTVRGQLEVLMDDFEKDGTPPWASGAMRQAMGVMQARGMGASSMAGQAIVQAAMESAIGIAERDAATVAQFEMQNLNNEQQTMLFKTQTRINTMLSDQSASNAAKQFNASSENQVNQFFSELKTTVSRFNAEQVNAIRQFNAGEENAGEKFNKQMETMRDQFNASNSLVIAQANAQWRQTIATADTAAQNESNMTAAKTANGLTQTAVDQIWQRERDIMSAALTMSEGEANRNLSLLLANKEASALASAQKSQDTAAMYQLGANLLFGLF